MKSRIEESMTKDANAVALGAKGGKQRAKNMTKKQRSEKSKESSLFSHWLLNDRMCFFVLDMMPTFTKQPRPDPVTVRTNYVALGYFVEKSLQRAVHYARNIRLLFLVVSMIEFHDARRIASAAIGAWLAFVFVYESYSRS